MVCGDGHQILVVACDDEGNGGAVPINRPRQTLILPDLAVIRGLALLHGLDSKVVSSALRRSLGSVLNPTVLPDC